MSLKNKIIKLLGLSDSNESKEMVEDDESQEARVIIRGGIREVIGGKLKIPEE